MPRTWSGRAAVTNLGYETILEAVAEKYHASQGAIRRLNPDAPWPNPPAGTVLTVPNPEPAPVGKAARISISLSNKVIEAWDARGALLARFPCSIAADKAKRPVGKLSVTTVAPSPNYTFDPAVYPEDPEAQAVGRKLLIPPGPNNPVGVAWIGLDLPGYGIHGTPKPEDISVTESHGCFRLANWNAAKLLGMVSVGTPVVVVLDD
ncbi:MAG: L,D-transpeptidase [bacterium]